MWNCGKSEVSSGEEEIKTETNRENRGGRRGEGNGWKKIKEIRLKRRDMGKQATERASQDIAV